MVAFKQPGSFLRVTADTCMLSTSYYIVCFMGGARNLKLAGNGRGQ